MNDLRIVKPLTCFYLHVDVVKRTHELMAVRSH